MRTLVLLLAVCACHKTDPNCERAVKHVIGLTTAGPPGSEPKADEQRVIDQGGAGLDRPLQRRGSLEAQRDCVLAASRSATAAS
ncbi:MAG: hypothetical protein IPQ07_37330 [Myxococcales bacterium]|nr:hypothetical protein [Myxococcales bacterium]